MTTSAAPILREARAEALWRHLADRQACIDSAIEQLPDDFRRRNLADLIKQYSLHTGTVCAISLLGKGTGNATNRERKEFAAWEKVFNDTDSLNVGQVLKHLCGDNYELRHTDLEVALDDLAARGVIQLVPEEQGQVRIELLKRPEDD
jgi:hypothetical protein